MPKQVFKTLSLVLIVVIAAMLLLVTVGCENGASSDAYSITGSDGEIVLSASKNNNKVDVTVRLNKNCGINSMLVELVYDTNALTLTGFDKGSALSTLDLMTTNVNTEKGYAITPFRFDYLNTNKNDASTGVMFTLHFSKKKNAKGKTTVGLKYTNGKIKSLTSDGMVNRAFAIKPVTISLS